MEDLNPIRRWFAEWRSRWHNVNGTAVLRLGDAAGNTRLSIRNSDDQEVFFFKSNGTSNIEPIEGNEGQALLRGGSRSLIGDLVVADGIKVDGVDISTFSAATSAWQAAHTSYGQHDILHVGADVEFQRVGANAAALGTGDSFQSATFNSGVYGYRLGENGDAEFNNIRARGELSASVFRRSEISAAAGTLGVFPGASTVHAAFTTPSVVGGSVLADIKNETPTSASASFSAGDLLQVKAWNGSSFISAYFSVNSSPAPSAQTGYTTYSLMLTNGSKSASVPAGTAVVNHGTSSGGAAVFLSADGTVGGAPSMTMQTHTGTPWEPTVLTRIGNLSGITDATFGALSGYGTYVSGNAYITGTVNATAGRISGVLDIGASGGIYQGTGTFSSPTTGVKLWNDSGIGRIAGYNSGTAQWYAGTDGSIYAGGGSIVLNSAGVSIGTKLFTVGTAGAPSSGDSPSLSGLSGNNGYAFASYNGGRIGVYAWRDAISVPALYSMEIASWGFSGGYAGSIVVKSSSVILRSEDGGRGVKCETPLDAYDVYVDYIHKRTGAGSISIDTGISGTTASFSGELSAAGSSFNGNLSVVSGGVSTFAVVAATGNTTVAGTLSVINALTAGGATINKSGLNVGSATGAALGEIKASAGISGTTGAFSSSLSAAGDFAVNTNKFTVASSSGNTVVAGTLNVTGATTLTGALSAAAGTFSGLLTAGANLSVTGTGTFSGALSATSGAFTGNVSMTVASGSLMTLASTGTTTNARVGFKLDAQNVAVGDYFSCIYMADGSPRRVHWTYNSTAAGTTPVLSMTASNQVGINVATPGYTLDVAGTLRATGDVTLSGADIITDATTGTRLGTATTQKIGFYGVTAVVQRASANQAAVATTGATNATPYGFTTAAQANAIVTLVNEMRTALVNLGLIKGSA